MEVNLGDATNFNALAAGSVMTITNYIQASISNAYPDGYTSLTWGAFACVDPTNTTTSYPLDTLWVTKPRKNPSLETNAWTRHGSGNLILAETMIMIDTVGDQQYDYSTIAESFDPVKNNTTTVLIPSGNSLSYSTVQDGTYGSFKGAWEGNLENTTPSVSPPWVSRSDLFLPAAGERPRGIPGILRVQE